MTPTPITTPAPTAEAARSRRNYTAQEKAEHLALQEQSGLTQADYCREFGLNEATFSLWRRNARGESAASDAQPFAEVVVAPTVSETPTTAVLHFSNGTRLEIHAPSEATWRGIATMLRELKS